MMMIPCPRPWDEFDPARFRLPGYGGAAVFLRSQILPASAFDTDGPSPAFDVMLLSPQYHAWYLSRPASPGFVDRLAGFLFAAANDFHPEVTVASIEDEGLGLALSVVSSTDDRVGLEITVVEDLDAEVAQYDGLDFETSRATLAACAQSVRCLDGSWPDAADDFDEVFGS